MRADRLLSILLLLQAHQRMTARELARRLEVSERTIHRDMEALGMAGVPVTAERGIGGGWALLADYRTNLTGLNEAEVQALFLAGPSRLLADLGLRQASEGALIKLLASLPVMQRRDAEFARQRIYIDAGGWHRQEETVPCLPTLLQATWQERKIRFAYQRGDSAVERVADPLGLVARGSTWYLVAQVDGDLRTYRVSRIQQVEITEQPCTRPPDFDLATFWSRSSSEFKAKIPRFTVLVRVKESVLPRMHHPSRFITSEVLAPPDEQGWATVRLLFDIGEEARAYLLSFGTELEVLEPPEVRAEVIALAESVLSFYRTEIQIGRHASETEAQE